MAALQRWCALFSLVSLLAALAVAALLFDLATERPTLETKYSAIHAFVAALSIVGGARLIAGGWRLRFHPGLFFLLVWLIYHWVLYAAQGYNWPYSSRPPKTPEQLNWAQLELLPYLTAITAGVFAALVPWRRRELRLLLGSAAAVNVLVCVYALLQVLGIEALAWFGMGWYDPTTMQPIASASSTFGNKNFVGSYMAIWAVLAVPFLLLSDRGAAAQGFWARVTSPRKTGWLAYVALLVFTVLASLSRGALLGMAIGLFALFAVGCLWIRSRRVRRSLTVAALVTATLIGGGIYAAASFERLAQLRTVWLEGALFQSTSFANRIVLWTVAVNMWMDAPLLGRGVGSYRQEFFPYFRDLLLDEQNQQFRLVAKRMQTITAWQAHNEPLQILAEQGMVGLLLFLLMYIGALQPLGARIAASARQDRFDWLDAARVGVFSALCCYAGSVLWTFPFRLPAENLLFYVLIGAAAALSRPAHDEAPSMRGRLAGLALGLCAVVSGGFFAWAGTTEFMANRHYFAGFSKLGEAVRNRDRAKAAEAESHLRRCLALTKGQGRAYFQLGNKAASFAEGFEYAKAVGLYNRALDTYANISVFHNLAQLQTRQRQYEKAEEYWRVMRVLQPEQRGILLELGKIAYLTNRYDEAIRLFQEEIDSFVSRDRALYPDILADAYLYLGLAHQYKGDAPAAVRALLSSLTIRPNHVQASFQLGRLYAQPDTPISNLNSALYHFDRALRGAESLNQQRLAYEIKIEQGKLRARLEDAIQREERRLSGGATTGGAAER